MTKRKIGVLVSGRGSNFQAVADKIKKENLPIEIAVVISDSPEAYALQRAEKMGIPHCAIARQDFVDKASFEAAQLTRLRGSRGGTGGAGRIHADPQRGFREFLVPQDHQHPSGPAAVLYGTGCPGTGPELRVKIAGCTVHFVDAGMDTGPIIMQAAVPVLDEDTHDTLAAGSWSRNIPSCRKW